MPKRLKSKDFLKMCEALREKANPQTHTVSKTYGRRDYRETEYKNENPK